jgi:hypothetical protein
LVPSISIIFSEDADANPSETDLTVFGTKRCEKLSAEEEGSMRSEL